MIARMLITVAALLVPASQVAAQSYTCVDRTGYALALRNYMVRLTTATSDTVLVKTRVAYQLPVVSSNAVTLVKTKNTCATAAQAYHAHRRPGQPPISRTELIVVKVGADRWVVLDPNDRLPNNKYLAVVVFDANWNVLESFLT